MDNGNIQLQNWNKNEIEDKTVPHNNLKDLLGWYKNAGLTQELQQKRIRSRK